MGRGMAAHRVCPGLGAPAHQAWPDTAANPGDTAGLCSAAACGQAAARLLPGSSADPICCRHPTALISPALISLASCPEGHCSAPSHRLHTAGRTRSLHVLCTPICSHSCFPNASLPTQGQVWAFSASKPKLADNENCDEQPLLTACC